jgi:hypothetical protein
MTVAQIRSLLARQMSTHQSTVPVLEAIIEHLADLEANPPLPRASYGAEDPWTAQVPAAGVTEIAPPSTETAEAPAPPKAEGQKPSAAQEK